MPIERLIPTDLFISLPVFSLAFSLAVRKAIGTRDHWTCQDCGDSYQEGTMVHASHFDHDRANPLYDTPEMGRIQCVDCHQVYHEMHQGVAYEIGLTEQANQAAIELLEHTIRERLKW